MSPRQDVVARGGGIRSGKRISLALPVDSEGPQIGGFGRFNPIHLMFRDGGDIVSGTIVDDFYGGNDRHIRGTDDMIIMPLQSGTQWDALAHIMFEDKMYNGYPAKRVTSKGAHVNDITQAQRRRSPAAVCCSTSPATRVSTRSSPATPSPPRTSKAASRPTASSSAGRLRDDPHRSAGRAPRQLGRLRGRPGTGPGLRERAVGGRTRDRGRRHRHLGHGGAARTRRRTSSSRCTASSSSRWGCYVGEIFDLEELGADCAADGQYDFFFCAPPLPITQGVGSPVNPMAIK